MGVPCHGMAHRAAGVNTGAVNQIQPEIFTGSYRAEISTTSGWINFEDHPQIVEMMMFLVQDVPVVDQ